MIGINNLMYSAVQPPPFPPELEGNIESNDPYPLFPAELKPDRRWVVWTPTKIPFDAKTGKPADSTDPNTWSDYSTAIAVGNKYAGIGCMLAPPYCVIDLDKCRNAETGAVEPWAKEIIRELIHTLN